jgi:hypothetical protein
MNKVIWRHGVDENGVAYANRTEIHIKHGHKDIQRLFHFMIVRLCENATLNRPFYNETAYGNLVIYKYQTDGSVYYNVYYFKNSWIRRVINYIKDPKWTSQ